MCKIDDLYSINRNTISSFFLGLKGHQMAKPMSNSFGSPNSSSSVSYNLLFFSGLHSSDSNPLKGGELKRISWWPYQCLGWGEGDFLFDQYLFTMSHWDTKSIGLKTQLIWLWQKFRMIWKNASMSISVCKPLFSCRNVCRLCLTMPSYNATYGNLEDFDSCSVPYELTSKNGKFTSKSPNFCPL